MPLRPIIASSEEIDLDLSARLEPLVIARHDNEAVGLCHRSKHTGAARSQRLDFSIPHSRKTVYAFRQCEEKEGGKQGIEGRGPPPRCASEGPPQSQAARQQERTVRHRPSPGFGPEPGPTGLSHQAYGGSQGDVTPKAGGEDEARVGVVTVDPSEASIRVIVGSGQSEDRNPPNLKVKPDVPRKSPVLRVPRTS